MDAPLFRLVCTPAAVDGAPAGWARVLMRDGHLALLPDETALEGINRVAHALGTETVSVVRVEETAALQDETVITWSGALPLVWLSRSFSDRVRTWARDRGPMTLLVEADGPLSDADRRRVERFVALLGRQAE